MMSILHLTLANITPKFICLGSMEKIAAANNSIGNVDQIGGSHLLLFSRSLAIYKQIRIITAETIRKREIDE